MVCWGSFLGDGKHRRANTGKLENGANLTYTGTLSAHSVISHYVTQRKGES
jgi:hypothetical protein